MKRALLVGDCKHCQKQYCLKHRLPEAHLCSAFDEIKSEAKRKNGEKLMAEKTVASHFEKI
jgi:predicted nucleic acid binding AN1-type Zn finger protein